MRPFILLFLFSVALQAAGANSIRPQGQEMYDFRTHPAYGALSDEDRVRLEQVHHDFALIWGALEMYADDHGGRRPDTLDGLLPLYLRELPLDPFANDPRAAARDRGVDIESRGGRGYDYRAGADRAWIIASAGLPSFPYLAREDNVGLYICKGTWISGHNLSPMPPADD